MVGAMQTCHTDFNSIKVRLEPSQNTPYPFPRPYFNSIKVRLEPRCLQGLHISALNFNSIKVRLERPVSPVSYKQLTKFQFHKGTIRTLTTLEAICWIIHFNSIKVRLEQSPQRLSALIPRFQFHKGTIRTDQL